MSSTELDETETSPPHSQEGSNGDDAESWTILDEEPEDLELREESSTGVATTHQDDTSGVQEIEPDLSRGGKAYDTDSDIEAVDENYENQNQRVSSADGGPESLRSDGIPVGEDLSGDQDQYIWAPDTEMVQKEVVDGSEKEHHDLASQYPTEELPEKYFEIQKGHTYVHTRNQNLNLFLTCALVVVVAAALGLGIGNFLGWSSRNEIHEQFAEVQDEKLEELTDSLVSCMTGPEGQGGDDQDLDDRVIQQLSEENRRLKEELELARDRREAGVAEEMTVILRDRISDLLLANAELEKEVSRLRYSQSDNHIHQTQSDLTKTKSVLNEIAAENEQLKIAIGKARYGIPPPGSEGSLEQLQMENDELKSEVERIRRNLGEALCSDEPITKEPSNAGIDEGYLSENEDQPNAEQNSNQDHLAGEYPPEEKDFKTILKSAADVMHQWAKNLNSDDVTKVVNDFSSLTRDYIANVLPPKVIDEIAEFSNTVQTKVFELRQLFENSETNEKDGKGSSQKFARKLSKTLKESLKRLGDILNADYTDQLSWEGQVVRLRENLERKWSNMKQHFGNVFNNEEKPEKAQKAEDKKTKSQKKKRADEILKEEDVTVKSKSRKWSKKEENRKQRGERFAKEKGNSTQWIFARAEERAKARKEEQKSDWIFDRAHGRDRSRKEADITLQEKNIQSQNEEDSKIFHPKMNNDNRYQAPPGDRLRKRRKFNRVDEDQKFRQDFEPQKRQRNRGGAYFMDDFELFHKFH